MEKVKVVIIGYGSMGRLYSDMLASGQVPELELYGICCRNPQYHVDIGIKFPQVKIYPSDSEAFFNHQAYNAIIITTPHKTHVQIALKALSKGLHVLCEKPLGVSLQEAKELESASNLFNRQFAMVFNWRTRAVFSKVKDLISQGGLGKISHAVWIANFWYRTSYYHHLNPWRSSWTGEGGGLAINQMQHVFDIWNWLFGIPEEVNSVVSYGKFNEISVDDSFEALFTYQNGLHGVCIASSGESPGSNHFEIHGTLGKVVIENNTLKYYRNETPSNEFGRIATVTTGLPYVEEDFIFEDRGNAEYVEILRDFGDSILQRKNTIASLAAGLGALTIANAVYLSSWKKTPIKIPFDDKEYQKLLDEHIIYEGNGEGSPRGDFV